MENDDAPVGYLLTRREALSAMGTVGVLLFSGCRSRNYEAGDSVGAAVVATVSGVCVARPEQTEGPYFVDEKLNRSDIRSDPSNGQITPGAPLELTFNVSRLASNACTPLSNAMVDIWQCDHLGVYSDATDPGFDTRGKKFLRGHQITNASGIARFTTIYPGWYGGRAVHIHFKIRSASSPGAGYDFTSQLYFDDSLTDTVHARPPYAAKGQRDRRNPSDRIYRENGDQLLLAVKPAGQGYAATFDIALQGV